jgi:transcriptional regulator with XRE-family HTH domain
MEIGNEKVREYLIALKEAGHFSYEDVANLSGTPVQTVRNYYSGKTPNPSFATVAKMIISLGGDLNEIIGYEKKKEIEVNSTVSLKETYEMRIADLIKSYEERIEDIKALCDQRVDDVRKCYEMRITDIRQGFKEMLAELREMMKK